MRKGDLPTHKNIGNYTNKSVRSPSKRSYPLGYRLDLVGKSFSIRRGAMKYAIDLTERRFKEY